MITPASGKFDAKSHNNKNGGMFLKEGEGKIIIVM